MIRAPKQGLTRRRTGRRAISVATAVLFPLTGGVVGGVVSAGAVPGSIVGTVFRDVNANGAMDAGETGVGGVEVRAFSGSNAPLSTTTASDGSYTIGALISGTTYRVEFTNLPSYLTSSPMGSGNASSVQFVMENGTANYAVQNPGDYCQANPSYALSCFAAGVPASGSGQSSLFTAPFNGGSPTAIADADETGPVYGVAYQRSSQRLFHTTLIKRHVGQPEFPAGIPALGMLYKTEMGTVGTPTTPWVDLENLGMTVRDGGLRDNATRGVTTTPNEDLDPLNKVHKYGLLDLEITEDDSSLFVVNGFDRNIYQVDLPADGSAPTSFASNIGNPGMTCTNGVARPGGIAIKDGKLYAGFLCDASVGGTATDLTIEVWTYQITGAPGWSVTPALGPVSLAKNGCTAASQVPPLGCAWQPWKDLWDAGDVFMSGGFPYATAPQPVLSDLAIANDGSLIIAIRDRFGDLTGRNQLSNGAGNPQVSGLAGGDILRACAGSGTFTLEGSGSCTRVGSEYFTGDDFVHSGTTYHDESAGGAVLTKAGSNSMVATFNNPVSPTTDNADFFSTGVRWFDTSTGGNPTSNLRVLGDVADRFGKANGMGLLELICDQTPTEIGNRVWSDTDNDGRQDSDEPGLGGVVVKLFASNGTTLIDSTTTDSSGNYLFSSAASGTGGTGAKYGVTQLTSGQQYVVRIIPADSGSVLTDYVLSPANAAVEVAGDVTQDDSDSDLLAVSGQYQVTVTAAVGANHTTDAGFNYVPPVTTTTSTTTTSTTSTTTTTEPTTTSSTTTTTIDPSTTTSTTSTTTTTTTTIDPSTTTSTTIDPSTTTSSTTTTLGSTTTSTTVAPTSSTSTSTTVAPTSSTTTSTTVAPTSSTTTSTTTTPSTTTASTTTPSTTTASTTTSTTVDPSTTTATTTVTPTTVGSTTTTVTPTTVAGACSSVGNYVWFDTNNNGVIEASEAGASGVIVRLLTSTGAVVVTTQTNSNGYYLFSCIPDGNYKIQIVPPAGYQSSNPTGVELQPNPITETSDFDDNGAQVGLVIESATFNLSAATSQPVGENNGGLTDNVPDNRSNLTVDFGLFLTPVSTTVPGATTTAASTTIAGASTTTAGGSTTVAGATTIPGASTTTPGATTTLPGTPGSGSLCSEIFVDTNGNGERDPGEPALAGVTVALAGPVNKTATTDAQGKYCFEGLPAGSYTVSIISGVPAEYGYLTEQVLRVNVLGVTEERQVATFRVAPLAFTGAQSGRLVGFGAGLILAGAALVFQSRSGRRPALHSRRK